MEDGRIVVSDIPRHRVFQVFHSDGRFDRGVRVGNDLLALAERIYGGRDGVVVAGTALMRLEEMVPEEQRSAPGTRRILRAALDGDDVVFETVFEAWDLPPVGEFTLRVAGREIPTGGATPPAPYFWPGPVRRDIAGWGYRAFGFIGLRNQDRGVGWRCLADPVAPHSPGPGDRPHP